MILPLQYHIYLPILCMDESFLLDARSPEYPATVILVLFNESDVHSFPNQPVLLPISVPISTTAQS